MKGVAGRLRLDLAQYRELEAFSAFGSDLDKASKAQLERGARLVELLKQPQYTPYPVERQVVSIWAGTSGNLDDVPVADISKFEREFLDYVGRQHKGIYDAIVGGARVEGDLQEQLENAIGDFKKTFETSSGEAIGGDDLRSRVGSDTADAAEAKEAVDTAENSTEDKAEAAADRTSGES
jgi:F-type H+-transporting ATPase subunit alpha